MMGTGRRWRRTVNSLLAAGLFSGILCPTCAMGAQAPVPLASVIPSQDLADALTAFYQQTGMQVVYLSDVVGGRRSKGAPAGLSPKAALARLLAGTGLTFVLVDAHTARIVPAGSAVPAARGTASDRDALEQVVVFGTPDRVPSQRSPSSLVVWTATAMADAGITDVQKLASLTPGVDYAAYSDYGAGLETNVAIRGVNARDGSTTAIYFDDVPLPSDRLSLIGPVLPATFDVDRVQVLRGPQGVLFGEGAEGGVIQYLVAAPDLKEFSGDARSEFSATARGTPGYEVGAAAGGPLVAETLGFRVSAWTRREGGYVDRIDPFSGAIVDAESNWEQHKSFRAALTLAPAGSVQITPSVSYQSHLVHDTSAFFTYLSDPSEGVLANGKLLDQPYADVYSLAEVKTVIRLNGAELKLVSAYLRRHATAIQDNTNNHFLFWPNPMGPEYPVPGATPVLDPLDLSERVVFDQLRVGNSDPGERLAWLVGADYVHAHYVEFQPVVDSELSDGGFVDGATYAFRGTIQLAGYGQFDLSLGSHLHAMLGARVEQSSYVANVNVGGIGPTPFLEQWFQATGRSTPYAMHAGLSYHADDGALYYANIAKGYRAGGPNQTVGVFCSPTPLKFGPDSLWSFEVGTKVQLSDGRLQLDASVFHMRWRDPQTQVPDPDCGFGYTVNAGAATSNGFDLGVQARLFDHWKVELTTAYTDAHYTQTLLQDGQVVVGSGDAIGALPLVPAPWSLVASLDYERTISEGFVARIQAQDMFHGRNSGPFTTDNPGAIVYAPERGPDPSTQQVNMIASAVWRRLELSLFVRNALDSQPVLQRRNRIAGDTLFYATTLRPRTVGLSANWSFGPGDAQ
jgi:iron complex outermembrane recepter protein